ncbi:NADPH:quinone reductase-like Zn-dependent oxidoreductase [Paenibacillus rhizosphaerae]|uniref:NADPH:quinone reductase-like Zn-dependent oxidoreductase n=1 Tax=Paenibacillus rhizosphaerae TaxID=297318 RepID=A0A839TRC7_9BACL|nr:zinc-binding dehydrogenase [Paenibacillus rhizosphaerae]MBB3129101.1 NADPH:quinone reductase-like Zn-dependent oxidoreductase [Paenibacillus rhizosphaerae]
MKALTVEQPGEAQALRLKKVKALSAAPGRLTVDVVYAGVGFVDVMLARGEFDHVQAPYVPGLEIAGYVREIGEGVEGFRVGEPVAGMTLSEIGGFATVVSVRPELTVRLAELDSTLDLAVAAASVVNLTTALIVMKDVIRLQTGGSLLVHAAAGGLGSFLGQVARRLGAGLVLGTVGSENKKSLASSLGYDGLFVRSGFVEETMRATGRQGVDAVLDPVGGAMRRTSLDVMKPFGQLVVLGNAGGEPDTLQSTQELWFKNLSVAGFQLGTYSDAFPERAGQRANEALQMLAKGEVHADIFGIYPAHEANEALRLLETGSTRGKLLLKMDE